MEADLYLSIGCLMRFLTVLTGPKSLTMWGLDRFPEKLEELGDGVDQFPLHAEVVPLMDLPVAKHVIEIDDLPV